MSYHGALLNGTPAYFETPQALGLQVSKNPDDVIITKTHARGFAGPLTLADDPIIVAGPDPATPQWIAVVKRVDGVWKVVE